jgi:hypothetical protein
MGGDTGSGISCRFYAAQARDMAAAAAAATTTATAEGGRREAKHSAAWRKLPPFYFSYGVFSPFSNIAEC